MGQYDYTGMTGASNYSGENSEYRNGSNRDRMGSSYQGGYRGDNRTSTNRWSMDEGDEATGSSRYGDSTRRGSYGSGSRDSDSSMTSGRYGSGSSSYGSGSSSYGSSSRYDDDDYAAGGRYGSGNRYSSGGYGTSNYGTSTYGGSRSNEAPYGRSYGSGQAYGSTGSYGTDEDYSTGTSYGRGSRYGSSTDSSRSDYGYGSSSSSMSSSSGSYGTRSDYDYDDNEENMSYGSDDYRDGLAIDETRTLISSSKVEGTAVYDRDGSRMGTIHNFMVNKRSGRVDYAVLSFGGFLGMGTRYYPLPWDMLEYDTSQGGYAVDMDEDDLDNAPSFRSGEEPDFSDSYGEHVYSYYGMRY